MSAESVLQWTLIARDRASDEFDRVGRSASSMEAGLKRAAFGVGVALGVAAVAAVKFAGDSIQAFAEAQTAQNRLNFAYEKFPALAGGNVDALRKMNTALQLTTRFEDDAIASAQGILAQYDLSAEQLERLTPLMLDYAAATGKDVTSAAEDLGKAVLGQGRALKAVGIDFVDAGDPAANFGLIIDGLSAKVGGFAEKDAATLSGKLDMLKNKFGEIQEGVGAALAPLAEMTLGFLDDPRLSEAFSGFTPELAATVADLAPNVEKLLETLAENGPTISEFASNGLPVLVQGLQDVVDIGSGFAAMGNDPEAFWSDFFGFTDYIDGVGEATGKGGKEAKPISADDFFESTGWYERGQRDAKDYTDGLVDGSAADQAGVAASTAYAQGLKDGSPTAMIAARELASKTLLEMDARAAAWVGTGQHYGDGLAEGLRNRVSTVREAATMLANEAIFTTRNVMGVKSPSTVAYAIGEYWGDGMALGVESKFGRVNDSAAAMASGLSAAIPGYGAGGAGGGLAGGGGLSVTVDMGNGFMVGTSEEFGQAVATGLIQAARSGQLNALELNRALGTAS